MSRIADLASTNRILQTLFDTQKKMRDTELQVSTGKVSQTYDNIFLQSQRLVNMENTNTDLQRFVKSNSVSDLRLDIAGTVSEAALTTAQDFRELLSDFNNSTATEFDVENIQTSAYAGLLAIQDLLNSQADGVYIFSGSKFNTPPVDLNLSSLTAFQSKYDGVANEYPRSRDAHLAEFSFSSDTQNDGNLFTTASNFLTFKRDDDGNTATTGRSSIEATSNLFRGLSAGTQISITNTASNNGTYTIDEVSSDGTKVFLKTEMLTDEAAPASLSDQGLNSGFAVNEVTVARSISRVSQDPDTTQAFTDVTIDTAAGTITDNSALNADLTASGITAGDVIQINDGGNPGYYTVQSVVGAVITIDTDATPTTTITPSGGTAITLADMGSVFFDADSNQITAETAGAFNAIAVNGLITVAGTGETASGNSNDSVFKVIGKVGDTLTVREATTITLADPDGTLAENDNAVLDVLDTGGLTYNRAANTITAVNANTFANAAVGETITVANATVNSGEFTISAISADGRTITIENTKLTDEGSSGTTFFDQPSFTQVNFDNSGAVGTHTIQVQTSAGAALTNVFSDFKAGQSITMAGAVTGTDATYTISAVSADGSTLTVEEDVGGLGVDVNSISFTGPATTGFTYTTQTNLEFSAANRITVNDDVNNTINGSFDSLRVGQTITIGNATTAGNNGTYLISAIDVDGGYIDVTNTDGTAVTFTAESGVAATTAQVFAADGTISANNSYYKGDSLAMNYRVDTDRSFNFDVTAIDPAFEKIIRAMGIIAQGAFGTEGGLENNQSRVEDAQFLLDHALNNATVTRTGFSELKGNIPQIIGEIGFDKFIIDRTNDRHVSLQTIYSREISKIEDVDTLESITRLLEQGRSLEASYQALSRVEGLSLVNFLN